MRKRFTIVVLAAIAELASCSLRKQDAPFGTGPSEQALSLLVTASPDLMEQDGRSEAAVTVTARDAMGQPVSGLVMRADILVNGIGVDFGSLSSRSISTGRDGRAGLVYLSPPPPPPSAANDVVVTVLLTPIGTDFASTVPRSVQIRLVRPGLILPPNGTPRPNFSFAPPSPREYEAVQFDASASSDEGTIVSYSWDFGDGTNSSGVRATHAFALAGTYQVTLTVTNDRHLSASTTIQAVVISISSTGYTFAEGKGRGPPANSAHQFETAAARALRNGLRESNGFRGTIWRSDPVRDGRRCAAEPSYRGIRKFVRRLRANRTVAPGPRHQSRRLLD